jgi:MFS family permease
MPTRRHAKKRIPPNGTALLLIDVINDLAFEGAEGLIEAAEEMAPRLLALKRRAERPKLLDSVRMVWRTPHLVILLAVVMAASLTMDPIQTVTPEFSKAVFHQSDTLTGYLIGAFGVGAVIASVFPLHEPSDRSIALLFALFGGGMVGFALAPGVVPAFIALGIAGLGYLAGQTRATTLLQLEVAEHERGRVMALWSVAFQGSRPLASLIDGGIATVGGPRLATIVMSVPSFVVAVLLLVMRDRRPKPTHA